MKQQKRILNRGAMAVLLFSSLLCSCSQDEQTTKGKSVPIQLNAVVGDRTFTRFTNYNTDATQSTKIYPGQYVWAWALFNSNQSSYMTAWRLTANPGGTLSGSAKYYPDTGAAIDIIAVQGNFTETLDEATETDFPRTGLTHSVKDDQSALADYASSDLLYARVDNRRGSDNSVVTLPFKHYLSKIEITLESPHYSLDDLKHATVEIVNVQKSATISMNNNNESTEPTVTTTGATGNILLKDGAVGNARGVGDATNGRDYLEGIVPPQPLTEGNAFIKVTLTSRNNRVLYYQIPAGGVTLVKNQRYQYIFTLYESNITLSGATYQEGFDDTVVGVVPEA